MNQMGKVQGFTAGVNTLGTLTAGTVYTNGTYTGVPLTASNGTGTGCTATIVVSGAGVTSVLITSPGSGYLASGTLTCANTYIGGTGSGWSVGLATVFGAMTQGSGYVSGTYNEVMLTGGSGTGVRATLTVTAGAVTSLVITNPGQNYLATDSLGVLASNLGGQGSGFALTPAVVSLAAASPAILVQRGTGEIPTPVVTNGNLTGIVNTVSGYGYVTTPTVLVQDGGSTGAAATVTTAAGTIFNTYITAAGTGGTAGVYGTLAAPIAITGGTGSGATGIFTVANGGVTNVQIVNAGTGFAYNDTGLSASGASIGNVSGFTFAVTGVYQGQLRNINITAGGSGYTNGIYGTVTSPVAITGGVGSGASGIFVVSGGAVTNVIIVNPGVGYASNENALSASASQLGGTGTGLVLAESGAAAGGIRAYTVTTAGSNYTFPPSITLTGLASGGTDTITGVTHGVPVVLYYTINNTGTNLLSAGPNATTGTYTNITTAAPTLITVQSSTARELYTVANLATTQENVYPALDGFGASNVPDIQNGSAYLAIVLNVTGAGAFSALVTIPYTLSSGAANYTWTISGTAA